MNKVSERTRLTLSFTGKEGAERVYEHSLASAEVRRISGKIVANVTCLSFSAMVPMKLWAIL